MNTSRDVTPSAPRYVNLFEPFHFFTAGYQLVVPIGASRISLPLQEIQSREWEEREQTNKTNNMPGVNSSAEGELCNIVHVLTNASVDSSETSTKLLECRLILTRPSFTGPGLTHDDWSLCFGVDWSLSSSFANCQLLSSFCLTLWLASPHHFRSHRDRGSITLCLVSRQNRQRNRLLGGPPT